jgi:hypothetical protein
MEITDTEQSYQVLLSQLDGVFTATNARRRVS